MAGCVIRSDLYRFVVSVALRPISGERPGLIDKMSEVQVSEGRENYLSAGRKHVRRWVRPVGSGQVLSEVR